MWFSLLLCPSELYVNEGLPRLGTVLFHTESRLLPGYDAVHRLPLLIRGFGQIDSGGFQAAVA